MLFYTDCGSLPNPLNGTVYTNETTLDNDAVYSCDTGFILTGSVPRKCQTDGIWSGSAATCEPVNCSALVSPGNGSVTVTALTYTNTAIYSCSMGYVLVGSASTTCMADGNWSASLPSCIIVDCGTLDHPANGSVSITGTTYLSTATYSCLDGFNISGSSERTCLSDGNWNSSVPSCILVYCSSLVDPVSGNVSISGYTYMSTAIYTCVVGFYLMGSDTRVCMSDGNWNGSVPICVSSTSVTPTTSTASPITSAVTPSNLSRIYIMACICYTNKTFVGMTEEEIILHLIEDTKIDVKNTSRAKSKLICRKDTRESSKIMGATGACVLSTVLGVVIVSDLITLVLKIKGVNLKPNKVGNKK